MIGTRGEKEKEVGMLSELMENSQITVCAKYLGLTVEQATKMRAELSAAGAVTRVTRNTLARISAKNAFKDDSAADLEKFVGLLEGPSMMIFGKTEAVGAAKVIAKYAKDFEKFEVKGGWFDGQFVDMKGVDAVSKLPSREEVLSSLLRLMQTPATMLARVINAPAQQTVQVVEAQRKKLAA